MGIDDCCIPLRGSPAVGHAGSLSPLLGHLMELSHRYSVFSSWDKSKPSVQPIS